MKKTFKIQVVLLEHFCGCQADLLNYDNLIFISFNVAVAVRVPNEGHGITSKALLPFVGREKQQWF